MRAAYRMPRDPDDVPTVALALALGGDEGRCSMWTNDGDILGCGLPAWTTDILLAHLRYDERGDEPTAPPQPVCRTSA